MAFGRKAQSAASLVLLMLVLGGGYTWYTQTQKLHGVQAGGSQLVLSGSPVCGDGICSLPYETSSVCSIDCAPIVNVPSGGGGGGGGANNPPLSTPDEQWSAAYFSNPDLVGSPTLTVLENSIDKNSSLSAPFQGIPVDNFSVRWTKNIQLSSGSHTFSATADDGMRVYLDGGLLLDEWRIQDPTTFTKTFSVSGGVYEFVVEYYDAQYASVAKFEIDGSSSTPPDVIPVVPPPSGTGLETYSRLSLAQTDSLNSEFINGKTSWTTWTGSFSAADGVATQPANLAGTFPHFGQGLQPVGPGDRVRMEALVRSTGNRLGLTNSNRGCGIGFDLRVPGQSAIVYTLNGPATWSTNWTIVGVDFIVPDHGYASKSLPSSTYYVIDATTGVSLQSGTSGGSNGGRTNNADNGLQPTNLPQDYWVGGLVLPADGRIAAWNHNWFNTEVACEYEYSRTAIN